MPEDGDLPAAAGADSADLDIELDVAEFGDAAPDAGGFDDAPVTASRLDEAETTRRVAAVADVFTDLKRSLKQINLYRHNVAGYRGYLAGTYEKLHALLERDDALSLMVEQACLTHLNQPVYQEESDELNLAFRFYRDGIRLLTFRRGLTEQELLDFVLVCLTNFKDPEHATEDMGSLLWKHDFDHIEHVIMETFALGTESPEQTKIEVDRIVDYLYQSLSTGSRDNLAFARLSLDDLDIEIDDVEQVAGLNVRGAPAGPEEQMRFQHAVDQDRSRDNLRRLTGVLFRLFPEELDARLSEVMVAAFEQLLDGFLLQENLAAIDWLIAQLGRQQQQALPPGSLALAGHLVGHLRGRMCEAERIERVGEMLESSTRPELLQAVERYLAQVDERALTPLLAVLERITHPEARALLRKRLVAFGPEHLEHYVNRLTSNKANYVRDMLAIINELGPPDKTRILAGLLRHPNLALRVEALRAIGDGNDLSASATVMQALRDPDAQVRTTAAQLLPNFDPGVAFRALTEVAADADFGDKPDREQAAVFGALAALNDERSLQFLHQQLHAGGLLQRKQQAARKRNLIAGLAASGSIGAYRMLAADLKAGVRDQELAAQMQRACERLKSRLLGG